ncbi:MAG: glutamate--cysteine ligase [Thermoleophilia bacterium]|nr:glutamate--cysteine ligase [Thermoleophilia bacterium]
MPPLSQANGTVAPSHVEPSVEGWRDRFDRTSSFTLGAEEELLIIERDGPELAPVVDEMLTGLTSDGRFASELHASQIEIITPVCESVRDIAGHLTESRQEIVEHLDERYRLIAAGTHPAAGEECEITAGARYRRIARDYMWVATHAVPCGMHVHVAVSGADRALAVYNALRTYLPALTALGANSPYLDGRDTGLASIRAKLNESYPRSGIPPMLPDWHSLMEFERWGRRGGAFEDWTHFWWDLRLSMAHGTIEVRVPDAQTRVADAAALVAVVQSLALDLSDTWNDDGELPAFDSWRIRENSWLAQRHGAAGHQIDLATGEPVPTALYLTNLLRRLEPAAERLGCSNELAQAYELLHENGSVRQRRVGAERGVVGMVDWLAARTLAE